MKHTRGVVTLEAGDERITRLLHDSGHLVLGEVGGTHVCQPQTCAPTLACPGYNLYVCKQHLLHICSEQSCKFWRWDAQRQTCPISGIQYGAITSEYVKDDPRTWGGGGGGGSKRGKTAKLGPAAAEEAARDHIRHRASAMVKHLLYSNARIECNRVALRDNVARGEAVRARYDSCQAANGQPSYWSDRYRIMGHFGTEPLPFVIYVFDQALHDYYVNIIVQIWNKVDRYYVSAATPASTVAPIRPDIDTIAVAVMYCMRSGLRYENVQLLPKDDFIILNLPHVNQLPAFKISKDTITRGDRIIERTFQLAITRGVPDHELELAPDQVVVKQQHLKDDDIDDDDAAEESPTTAPLPHPAAAAPDDSFILDTNGEKLYKLKKRKK